MILDQTIPISEIVPNPSTSDLKKSLAIHHLIEKVKLVVPPTPLEDLDSEEEKKIMTEIDKIFNFENLEKEFFQSVIEQHAFLHNIKKPVSNHK